MQKLALALDRDAHQTTPATLIRKHFGSRGALKGAGTWLAVLLNVSPSIGI